MAFWVVLYGIPHFEGRGNILKHSELRTREKRNFALLILPNLQK